MSEAWRTLPEFTDYEITSEGDVRNRWSLKKLNESQNKNTGAWSYSLRRPNGRSTQRAFWGLVYSAFPELKPEEVKPEPKSTRSYSKRGLWRDIPGFPTYQAHPDGVVRYKSSKRFRVTHDQDGTKHVHLYDEDGLRRCRSINELMTELFGASV